MTRFWSPDMIHHTRTGETYRPDQVLSLMTGFMEAFPDLRFQIEHGGAAPDQHVAALDPNRGGLHRHLNSQVSGGAQSGSNRGRSRDSPETVHGVQGSRHAGKRDERVSHLLLLQLIRGGDYKTRGRP